ncbi:MAG: hypothetical protein U1F25_00795 [Rubrivivax sp.]
MTSWRHLDDAARERELSPSLCIGGDYRPFIAAYAPNAAPRRAPPGAR